MKPSKSTIDNPNSGIDRRTKNPDVRKEERRQNGRYSYKEIVKMCVFGPDGLLQRKLKKLELEEKKND